MPSRKGKASSKQITGIEPASSAWEADILPMYYICMQVHYRALCRKMQAFSKEGSIEGESA